MQAVILLLTLLLLPLFFLLMRKLTHRIRDNTTADYRSGEPLQISQNAWLLEKLGIRRERFFFDADYLYQRRKQETKKIPLSAIVRIKATSVQIGERHVWAVRYREDHHEQEVRFVHNASLFNANFASFLAAVREASPAADIEEIGMLTL